MVESSRGQKLTGQIAFDFALSKRVTAESTKDPLKFHIISLIPRMLQPLESRQWNFSKDIL